MRRRNNWHHHRPKGSERACLWMDHILAMPDFPSAKTTHKQHGTDGQLGGNQHCPDLPGLVARAACPSLLLARRSQLDMRLPVEGETTLSQISPKVLAGLLG